MMQCTLDELLLENIVWVVLWGLEKILDLSSYIWAEGADDVLKASLLGSYIPLVEN